MRTSWASLLVAVEVLFLPPTTDWCCTAPAPLQVLSEVRWVIFDEIHYLRDRNRGVVWEEVLILLPRQVLLVFLSATLPNADEFAKWVAKLKNK